MSCDLFKLAVEAKLSEQLQNWLMSSLAAAAKPWRDPGGRSIRALSESSVFATTAPLPSRKTSTWVSAEAGVKNKIWSAALQPVKWTYI